MQYGLIIPRNNNMKKLFIILSCISLNVLVYSQKELTLEALNTDVYYVPRTSPKLLTVRNSLFSSDKSNGIVLHAGDDCYVASNYNNLDGAKIIGNKFVWKAQPPYGGLLHGAVMGYNINYTTMHNYADGIPYAFIYKGGNRIPMTWTSGSHSYNIHRNVKVGTVVKGMSGVKIYNNTYYNTRYNNWHHIGILENNGSDQTQPFAPAKNTIIKNNIFYQKSNSKAIKLYKGATEGLIIDYNIYYCEDCVNHEPRFEIEGKSVSWSEWQALGYDTHSIIMDPLFIDTINMVPEKRLDFGVDLGDEFNTGLAVTAKWVVGEYPDTAKQNGKWQVGAVIKEEK